MLYNKKNSNKIIKPSREQLQRTSKLGKILREQYLASARAQGYDVNNKQDYNHKNSLHLDAQEILDHPETALTGSGLDIDAHPLLPAVYSNGMEPSHYNEEFLKELLPEEMDIEGLSTDAIRDRIKQKQQQKNQLKMAMKNKLPPPKPNTPRPTYKPSAPRPRPN